jgi:hypothetical protein
VKLRQFEFEDFGRGAQRGHAYGLGLEKRPQVGSLDVVAERRGLRAFAEGLGKCEHHGEDGDEQGDLPVGRIDVAVSGHVEILQRRVGRATLCAIFAPA